MKFYIWFSVKYEMLAKITTKVFSPPLWHIFNSVIKNKSNFIIMRETYSHYYSNNDVQLLWLLSRLKI